MTKEIKISIVIVIFSLLFLVISLKINPPSFITPFEKTLSNYSVPEINIKERFQIASYRLNDPFETSIVLETEKKSKESTPPFTSLPVLSFIYEGKNKYAVIGDSIVREGDFINGYQIKVILKNKVLIKDKKGETKWLNLENY